MRALIADDDADLETSTEEALGESTESDTPVVAQDLPPIGEGEPAPEADAAYAATSEAAPDTQTRPVRTRRRATALAASG